MSPTCFCVSVPLCRLLRSFADFHERSMRCVLLSPVCVDKQHWQNGSLLHVASQTVQLCARHWSDIILKLPGFMLFEIIIRNLAFATDISGTVNIKRSSDSRHIPPQTHSWGRTRRMWSEEALGWSPRLCWVLLSCNDNRIYQSSVWFSLTKMKTKMVEKTRK